MASPRKLPLKLRLALFALSLLIALALALRDHHSPQQEPPPPAKTLAAPAAAATPGQSTRQPASQQPASQQPAASRQFSGLQATFIPDGDTFHTKLPDGQLLKVRLKSIDAPERDQEDGPQARAALVRLIQGQPLELQILETDQYGRALAIVTCPGQPCSVNEEMVLSGWAWNYSYKGQNPNYQSQMEKARRAKLGLWAKPAPIRPSDFRKANNKP